MPVARVVALLSGGLDSTLAARIVSRQGLEVHGLNVRPIYGASDQAAVAAAELLDVPIQVRDVGDDYVEVLTYWGSGTPPEPIPEPATVGLLALGGLALLRRRR